MLSAKASRAADKLAHELGSSLTEALEFVLQTWRPRSPARRRRDRRLAGIERARVDAWYHFVRLKLGAKSQADVQRRTDTDLLGGGSVGRFARGERSPSLSTLNRWDRKVPGSASAYQAGPFDSLIWVALTSDALQELWAVVERHIADIAAMRASGATFEQIVDFVETVAATTPTLGGDAWDWDQSKPPLSKVPIGARANASTSPFCACAAVVALLRIARDGHHPTQVGRLSLILEDLAGSRLRGAASQMFPAVNELVRWLDPVGEGHALMARRMNAWTISDLNGA